MRRNALRNQYPLIALPTESDYMSNVPIHFNHAFEWDAKLDNLFDIVFGGSEHIDVMYNYIDTSE